MQFLTWYLAIFRSNELLRPVEFEEQPTRCALGSFELPSPKSAYSRQEGSHDDRVDSSLPPQVPSRAQSSEEVQIEVHPQASIKSTSHVDKRPVTREVDRRTRQRTRDTHQPPSNFLLLLLLLLLPFQTPLLLLFRHLLLLLLCPGAKVLAPVQIEAAPYSLRVIRGCTVIFACLPSEVIVA